jgi:hypothetical protein
VVYCINSTGDQGVMVHAYNPSTQEAEAGGSRVQNQLGQYSETLLETKTKIPENLP